VSAGSPDGARGADAGHDAAGVRSDSGREYRVQTVAQTAAALAGLAAAVDDWGGEWSSREGGGDLTLPVQAGLRHGLLRAHATAAARAGGCDLALVVDEERWALDRASVLLLGTAAVTSLAAVLWPFVPAVEKVAPLGLVLGATAWLAVLARLRHRGPAELLAEVEAALAEGREPEPPPPPIAPS
jgi:hypothetical protein